MNALEASIESLTTEHATLSAKLAEIDTNYKVGRPQIVSSLNQLAKALSALTGKPVAGASGQAGRKPMSEEGKAAIRAGLEKSRAAKTATAAAPAKPAQQVVAVEPAGKKHTNPDKGSTRAV